QNFGIKAAQGHTVSALSQTQQLLVKRSLCLFWVTPVRWQPMPHTDQETSMQYRFTTQARIKKLAAITLASLGFMSAACAAAWPERTVTIVVPFSAGGTTDIVARLVGDKLGQKWGQTVVVDNKLGAGG